MPIDLAAKQRDTPLPVSQGEIAKKVIGATHPSHIEESYKNVSLKKYMRN